MSDHEEAVAAHLRRHLPDVPVYTSRGHPVSLPPIPDEARRAAIAACDTNYAMSDGDKPDVADAVIAAVLPHLYAAALRHAADRAGKTFTGEVHADTLREWADEATL